MKFLSHYLILILVSIVLTVMVTPVEAKYPISVNPFLYSRTNVSIEYKQRRSNILLKGKQFYDEGRLNQAVQIWEEAIKESKKKGELHNQALGHNYLSGVYQDLGNWEAAKKSVNKALELIQTVDGGLLYAQILNTSGSLQLKTGNHQIALDNWKQSEQIYR